MKKLLVGTMALALGALGVSQAEASIVTLSPGGTFTGTIQQPVSGQALCADCSAEITFALSGDGTMFSVTLENTSTDGLSGVNTITALGITTTPDLVPISADLQGAFATGFEVSSGPAGLPGFEVYVNTTMGINNALDDGDVGTVVWTFGSALPSLTIDTAAIHIQQLAVPPGSTKYECCQEGGGGEGEGGGGEGEGGGGEGEGGVPEPASLLLLGLGLSGAAARIARRPRA